MNNALAMVQPAKKESECVTAWEYLYHTYRVVERRWDRLYGASELGRSEDVPFNRYSKLLDILKRPNPQRVIHGFRAAGALSEIKEKDIDLALELRKSIAEHSEMDDSTDVLLSEFSDPFEDAYHAALYIDLEWNYENPDLSFYRGQRDDAWELLSPIYRDIATYHYSKRAGQKLDDRVEELERFVTEIDHFLNDSEYPAYEEDELVAIAQHFHGLRSDEDPRPRSWLLDITFDPLVALFFATSPDDANTHGIVYRFRRGWIESEIPAISDNSGVRLIVPAGIPRIQRQEAAFLELHPIILNQYRTRQLRFEQESGLEFIDPYLGITKYRLLNANDPLLSELELGRFQAYTINDSGEDKDDSTTSISEIDMTLNPQSVTPPSWLKTGNRELHREMARAFVEQEQIDTTWQALTPNQQDRLDYAADYHAYLQEYDFDGPDGLITSINRFRSVVRSFCNQVDETGQPLSGFTKSVMQSEYREHFHRVGVTFEDTLREMEDEWDPP